MANKNSVWDRNARLPGGAKNEECEIHRAAKNLLAGGRNVEKRETVDVPKSMVQRFIADGLIEAQVMARHVPPEEIRALNAPPPQRVRREMSLDDIPDITGEVDVMEASSRSQVSPEPMESTTETTALGAHAAVVATKRPRKSRTRRAPAPAEGRTAEL